MPVDEPLACVLAAGRHPGADGRVRQALQEAGLKFLETPSGDFRLLFRLLTGRRHWV